MTGEALETPSIGAAVRALLLSALACWAAARLGLWLTDPPGGVALFWPPAGVALAAAIRLRRLGLLGAALGVFAAGGNGEAAALAAATSLQAGLAAWALRRRAAYPFAPATPSSVALFFALAGPLSGLALAFAALVLHGPRAALVAWVGAIAGVVVFAPALLAFAGPKPRATLRRAFPVIAVAAAGCAATASLAIIDLASLQRALRDDFALRAREASSRIEATVNLGLHAVEGLAGNFTTPHARDLDDFTALAEKLAAFGLGIQALEWIPRVPATELAGFEARMTQQWGRRFQVFERRDGRPVEASPREVYFPVGFVAPLQGNQGAVGFDLASDPARAAALRKAWDSGASVATPGVKLLQTNAMGILLFTPVYDRSASPASLKGFALGVFSLSDLVGVALRASETSAFDYRLIDETDVAAPDLLASNQETDAVPRRSAGGFEQQIRFPVADRRWRLQLSPTPAFLAKHSDASPYELLITGVALTALAIGLVLVAAARQHQLVHSRERDLENQKFALDQHAIVSITDRRGVLVYANDRFCEISGHPRERLIGASHNIVRSGKHSPAFYRELWTTLGVGEVWRGEICNRNAAGDLYWLAATLVPLKNRRGEVETYIAICTDITARKQLEQELESSRGFLQSVTDSMGEGVYTIDEKGECTFLNAEAERLLGWRFEELRGKRLHDVVHYQDGAGKLVAACDCPILHTLRARGKFQSEDEFFTHSDGRLFPVSVIAVRIECEGRPAGSVVVFQDITERRRMYQELEQSEQRLSIALSASSTGLWDYHPILDRAIYSDTWYRMLGYEPRPGPQSGALFLSLRHPDDAPSYLQTMAKHARGATSTVEVEFRMRRADGEWAWIRSIGKIIERDADGRPARLIGVHIDTTAAHKAQSDLAAAKDVAVRASQAKSEFLATMSHEIRTPMNAIIGLSHLLARSEMTPRQRDYLGNIQSASQSLLAIINDILDFSKIEAGRLSLESAPFDLKATLDGALAVTAPKIEEKGLSLEVERAEGLPLAFVGDSLRLSQVLTNLLSNAAKFTAKGAVRVRLGGAPMEDGRFRLEVEVADSGIGMTPEQMAQLFRPFTQADASTTRRFGGTGLGLAICRQIVTLMGGDISVRSVEGEGSTFAFHMPLSLAAAAEAVAPEPGAAEVRLAGAQILLVEDNLINQQVAIGLLEALGAATTVASSGEAALEILRARGFDLILMDMQMPGMDGLQTTRAIRETLGDAATPIVAMTANAMAEDRERCLAAGMNDHIGKPVDPDGLARTLNRWLEGRLAARPAEPAPPADLQIDGVEVEAALRNLDGNIELLKELLGFFVEEHRDQAPAIAMAAAEGQWKRVNALSHGLKGAAATLGAMRVAGVAREIEHAAREAAPDAGFVNAQVEALRAALAEVVAGIERAA